MNSETELKQLLNPKWSKLMPLNLSCDLDLRLPDPKVCATCVFLSS